LRWACSPSITGYYKFVGLAINMVAGWFFGKGAYYVCLAWTGLAMAFFTIKTLSAIKTSADDQKRRKMLLLVIGGMQIVLMWWLGYSGSLSQAAAKAAAGGAAGAGAGAAGAGAPLTAAAAAALKGMSYAAGTFAEKNELVAKGVTDGVALTTLGAAAELCAAAKDCGGFTWKGAKETKKTTVVHFKSLTGAKAVKPSDEWHAYQKKA